MYQGYNINDTWLAISHRQDILEKYFSKWNKNMKLKIPYLFTVAILFELTVI